MVDTIVSTVVARLTTAVIEKVEEEVKLVVGAKEDVEKLISNFRAIRAVLADANQRQLTEARVRDWIDDLKNVSYDIDDVLDEWSIKIQRAGKEGSEKVTDPGEKKKKNDFLSFALALWKYVAEVFPFIPFPCFRWEEIVLYRDIALKIKDLNSRLDFIATQRTTYQLTEISSNEKPPARPQTTSVIDFTEVGRVREKKTVIRMLKEKGRQAPHVVSIVGVGGLGKSTLAQLVFNDPEVVAYFNYKRIWVHVSNPFDEIKVAKAILESLTGKGSDCTALETITQQIRELIKNKCFLLVLDDVWNEDLEKWKLIKTSLLSGSLNSRILVTTRKENVARLMGCTESDMVRLGGLPPQDSWSLFSQLAFSGWSDRERQFLDLEETGRQLVDKCQGLPLAIRTLGIYLSTCKSRQKWLSVLRSEKWVEVAKTSLLPSLWFSYTDLTSDLKQCFSYCSIFPKGYKIEKYKLIELWMAQGYLSGRKGEDEEMVGENYFEELAARSFFQNFQKDEDDSIVACKMHDMVHDLAKYIASAECHYVEDGSSGDDIIKMDSSSTVQPRHLNIVVMNQTLLLTHFKNLKKLRTLFVEPKDPLILDDDLFSKLKCLRSLGLRSCGLKQIPSSITSLILLRWLDLSRNWRLEELPEELSELNNLQTLDISDCYELRRLPQGIGKLVKLKHLRNYDCKASFPKGIGRLSNLRTLEVFFVGNDGESATLGDLKSLKNIQGRLTIIGLGHVADLDEANQVQLRERDLTELELNFKGSGHHDQEVLEALEAPPSLRTLRISDYKGSSVFPNWLLSLTSLRKLELSECANCEHLPPLGKLKHLEHLTIGALGNVKQVDTEFLGVETSYEEDDKTHELEIFPKLAWLEFDLMFKWEAWNDINNSRNVAIMPRLRCLLLLRCEKLEALPEYVLQHPTLEKVVTLSSTTLKEKYPSEEWPKISHHSR